MSSSTIGAAIGAGCVAFIGTNMDDILVLVIFFAMARSGKFEGFHDRHIWAGQVLGFTCLVCISLVGFLVGNFVSSEWLGLLGFIPLLIGLYGLGRLIWARCKAKDEVSTHKKSSSVSAVAAAAPATAEAQPPQPQQPRHRRVVTELSGLSATGGAIGQ